MATKSSVEQLNNFLRGEMSAVETYRIAIDELDQGSPSATELEACMRSHQVRVDLLREQIQMLGGEPATGSGPWGVFAKAIETGAAILGDRASIYALEEGEDHGLKDYRKDMSELDLETRDLVTRELLPLQEQSHRRMSDLKKTLRAKS